jgi:hypothetical protein
MKHDRQAGVRVGLPVFFALELEDVYRHASGAHRALAFPDFLGFLIGLGLEAYRKGSAGTVAGQGEAPDASGAVEDDDAWDTEPDRGAWFRALAREED